MRANAEIVAGMESDERDARTASDRLAEIVTRLSGSVVFVWLHVVWFAGWIALSTVGLPLALLTMIVSLEAIFLSAFILIAQREQARVAERWEKVHLQVNVRAEQEVTTLIGMVEGIRSALLMSVDDPDAQEMAQPTRIRDVAAAVDEAEN